MTKSELKNCSMISGDSPIVRKIMIGLEEQAALAAETLMCHSLKEIEADPKLIDTYKTVDRLEEQLRSYEK